MQHCQVAVEQNHVYVSEGKAEIHYPLKSHRHTSLGAQILGICGCDGQTSREGVYSY